MGGKTGGNGVTSLTLRAIHCRTLHDLSLTLAAGESVAILGPSGSGKSTLLKLIAGLLPYRGQVCMNGVAIDRLPPHRRQLGYLSQEQHLFPHLSVAHNVLLPLLFCATDGEPRRQRVARALALTQASHLAAYRPGRLSGGERQRAALARCLVRGPRLLLLDEPFSALDLQTRQTLWHEFIALREAAAITTLLVTHDPLEARTLGQRVLQLHHGRLYPYVDRPGTTAAHAI